MKDIKNYEGLYAATEDGRIWSHKNQKFLKPETIRGYLRVQLCKDGEKKSYFVHRLICESYHENPDNLPCVNHISEDKFDNRPENLEWCTHEYNNTYGTRLKRIAESNSKPVYCIELNRTFKGLTEAAQELNLKKSNICYCLRGTRNTTGGYHWRYA